MFEELLLFGSPFVSGFSLCLLIFFLSIVMYLEDELIDCVDH